MEALNNKVCIW